jgi:UDP:flavonoid glycosyltransferase YjiC (YdhE family)
VIANAGYSLVCEALCLRKPYLAVPVQNQFEQIFNAFWLDRTGYGAFWEDLTREKVESFLFNIPQFREKLADGFRTSPREITERLDALVAQCLSSRQTKEHSGR